MRYQELEQQWLREGRIALPAYFSTFGVLSAKSYLGQLEATARREAIAAGQQAPSPAESRCLDVLVTLVRAFAPALMALFDTKHAQYTVATTEAALGALRQGRGYQSREVLLAATFFELDFAQALAVFLHEHAHIFGYDGSRGFTDALTDLLESVVRSRTVLDDHESRWTAAQQQVFAERQTAGSGLEQPIRERLRRLSEAELRTVLGQVPLAQLQTLLKASAIG